MKNYKGRFGTFTYDETQVDFELDDLAVSEHYHFRFLGDPDESYYDKILTMVYENPSKYDQFIERWIFSKEVPEGYRE